MKRLLSTFAVLALVGTSATTSTAWIKHNQQFNDPKATNETAQDIANKLSDKSINLQLDFWYGKNLSANIAQIREDAVDQSVLNYDEAQYITVADLALPITKAGTYAGNFTVTKDGQTAKPKKNVSLHVVAGTTAAQLANKIKGKDIVISPSTWNVKHVSNQIPLLKNTLVQDGLLKEDEAQYVDSATQQTDFQPLKTHVYSAGTITFKKYGQTATASVYFYPNNLLDYNNFEGENALNWSRITNGLHFNLEFDWQTIADHIFNFNNAAELFNLLFSQVTPLLYNDYDWTPASSWSSIFRSTLLSTFKIVLRNYLQTQIQNIYQQASSAYSSGVGFSLEMDYRTDSHKISNFRALKLKQTSIPKQGQTKVEGDNKSPGEQMSIYLNDQYSQLIDDFHTASGDALYNWLTGKDPAPQSFPYTSQFEIAANSGQTYAGYNVWSQSSLNAIKKALENQNFLSRIKQQAHANSFKKGIKISFLRYKNQEAAWVAPQGSGNNHFDSSKFEGFHEGYKYKTQFKFSSDQLLQLAYSDGKTNIFDSPNNAGKFYDWIGQNWQLKDQFNAFLATLDSKEQQFLKEVFSGTTTQVKGDYSWNSFRQDALAAIDNNTGLDLDVNFQQPHYHADPYAHTWMHLAIG